MEDREIKAITHHLAQMCEKLFEANQEHLLMIAAIQSVLDDSARFPDFRKAHQAKIQELRHGELGQQLAKDRTAFQRMLNRFQ